MKEEKGDVIIGLPDRSSRAHSSFKRKVLIFLSLLSIFLFKDFWRSNTDFAEDFTDVCPQQKPWEPEEGQKAPSTPSREILANLLSGAIQVNTSGFDESPTVAEDPEYWNAIYQPFRDYLYKAFPEFHSSESVKLELVNENGLFYTWKGSDENLKPIVFAAHQDVVPVESKTTGLWDYPPFSGHIDLENGLVYGRGAVDDKASLIMILTAATELLKDGFKPKRTIVFAFGFDEESAGSQGALQLNTRLEEVFGTHKEGKGVYMLIDEGNSVNPDLFGLPVAEPAVAEKGYLDVRMTVHTPGGHSSVPPKHTSIGYLSKIISYLEDHPHTLQVKIQEDGRDEDSAALQTLLCIRDAPKLRKTSLGKALNKFAWARKNLQRIQRNSTRLQPSCMFDYRQKKASSKLRQAKSKLEKELAKSEFSVDFTTTQAVDLIFGGVKVNALPEEASVVINHRIDATLNVDYLRKHLIEIASQVAKQYGLGVKAWQEKEEFLQSVNGDQFAKSHYIELEDAFDSALEPAPRTPTSGKDAMLPYNLLSSVIRHTYSDINKEDGGVRVIPSLMGGNTDTKSYWSLTEHIIRFAPQTFTPLPKQGTITPEQGIHTVNEVVQIDALTDGFRFYTALMMAAQQKD